MYVITCTDSLLAGWWITVLQQSSILCEIPYAFPPHILWVKQQFLSIGGGNTSGKTIPQFFDLWVLQKYSCPHNATR